MIRPGLGPRAFPKIGRVTEQTEVKVMNNTPEAKEIEYQKDDQHLHPLTGGRLQWGKDLPRIDDWSRYIPYAHKRFYINNPRLPSMNRNKGKFCCRRIYRVITFDGVLSGAYVSTIKNENAILFAIGTAIITTAYKTFNPDTPSTANEHTLTAASIGLNLFVVFLVTAFIGFLRKMYTLSGCLRSDEQDAQRALFDDYEKVLEAKMVVFSTRGNRFDSAGEIDAREAAQAIWSEQYNIISRCHGMPASLAQFFLLESESKREYYFEPVEPTNKTN